ncbi:ATPase, AAA family protein [Brugia malayi]|uniref:ATPase, AAA family protein n=3 Tax=Brugia TaxID=6278 RepID=A0A0J9YAJ0_BRUMA|nr:ATPase, AAA family protein [Brugia malayi]CDQ04923.1 BMA-CDC-48.3, isoform b [Brugia malayi]VIO99402.1 ATPase, AAA family protein [Brugia malayi]
MSKKKNTIIECSNCICYVHAKNLDLHQKECSAIKEYNAEFLLTSSVNIIMPNVGAIVTSQSLPNAANFLPPDIIGWEKRNVILMHPETMAKLQMLPRAPCWLTVIATSGNNNNANDAQCVTVWPCDEVKEMHIFFQNARICVKYRLNIVNTENIKKVSTIQLRPSSGRHFLPIYAKKHFRDYMATYLSNGYLGINLPVCIYYYGQEHCFDIVLSEAEMLKILTISSDLSTVMLLKPKSGCTCHVVDNTVASTSSFPLTFEQFGGAENAKREIEEVLIKPLKAGKEACSVILSGYTGCGKTLFLHIIQECLQDKSLWLSKREFEDFLENGAANYDQKMVLLVDNFDDMKQYTEKLCNFMDTYTNFLFVLAVRNVETIGLPLRGRFPCELELLVPSLSERMEILHLLLKTKQLKLSSAQELIQDIAQKSHGYTGGDLKAVLHRVFANFEFAGDENELFQRFDIALKRVHPTGIRQFVLQVPDVNWEDIGGNRELKMKIEQAILWPYRYPEIFKRFASKPPSGILLYGPPGCSKTLIARAIASQSRMNFLAVKGPELFSKWVGESERAVRELFRRARQVAPAIIFFDEIDAVGANRGDRNESHVGERVLTQLLTELDGLEEKGDVMVLAATNRPDRLDSALLRPGRFNLTIHVPLPDEETRLEILRIRLNQMQVTIDLDVEDISKRTEGFSGAEVVELCDQAVREALLENRDANRLEFRHFHQALKEIMPRTPNWLLNIYKEFKSGVVPDVM